MSYVESALLPNEKVLKKGRLHWIIYLPGWWGLFLSLAVHFAVAYVLTMFLGEARADFVTKVSWGAAAVTVLVSLFLLLGAYVRRHTTELAITNRRIIAKYGVIGRSTYEIMLNRVTGANFDQPLWGRLLGYGTILVHGAGGDVSPFDGVEEPQKFQRALIKVLERQGQTPQQP